MVAPYRAGEAPKALTCPRCNKALPPTDVAACAKGCGTWVSQFASTEVLTDADRKPDPVTRWWRVRAPCPVCAEKMLLCGHEPGLLQGCAQHGYFIDADTIQHTGLARGVDEAALDRKRNDPDRMDAERVAVAQAEEARTQRKLEQEAQAAAMVARERELAVARKREQLRSDIEHQLKFDHWRAIADLLVGLLDRVTALETRVTELEGATARPASDPSDRPR